MIKLIFFLLAYLLFPLKFEVDVFHMNYLISLQNDYLYFLILLFLICFVIFVIFVFLSYRYNVFRYFAISK